MYTSSVIRFNLRRQGLFEVSLIEGGVCLTVMLWFAVPSDIKRCRVLKQFAGQLAKAFRREHLPFRHPLTVIELNWRHHHRTTQDAPVASPPNAPTSAALLTTVNREFRRIAIHGTRESLLDQQADAAGLPLWKIDLPFPCSNADYESRMAAACGRAVAEGLHGMAFGDLFLEDIRAYRVARLASTGLEPIFPVWTPTLGVTTAQLARQMIAAGLRAHLTCIDPRSLQPGFAGRSFDAALLAQLPAAVDPCGERGEFHTFACAGPMFSRTIPVIPGETVERDNFIYADLLPAGGPIPASPAPEPTPDA